MIKNKWIVRLILLITIMLAGFVILFNIKAKDKLEISQLPLYENLLKAGSSWCNSEFWITDTQRNHGNGPFDMPYIANDNGRGMYCTQRAVTIGHTAAFRLQNDGKFDYIGGDYHYKDLFKPSDITSNGSNYTVKTTNARELDAAIKDLGGYGGVYYCTRTLGQFKCTGDHKEVTSESITIGGKTYPRADYAYVVTAEPYNKWTGIKQMVIWWLISNETSFNGFVKSELGTSADKIKFANDHRDDIIKLYKEAIAYRHFYQRVKTQTDWDENRYANSPGGSTESTHIMVGDKEYIKSGPYTLEYIYGRYGTDMVVEPITFGGISNLYLELSSGVNIDITKIMVNEKVEDVNTFVPIERPEDPNSDAEFFIERGTNQLNPHNLEEFYILVPKEQLTEEATLYAEFKWMRAEAEQCTKQSCRYYATSINKNTSTINLKKQNGLQTITEYLGERTLYECTLDLGPVTPPSPHPELATYSIKAQKVDLEGNGLAGATFNITWPNGDVSEAISDKKGNLVVQGDEPVLTITSEGLDHFKIEETYAPEGYSLISGSIEFDVKKEKADFTIGEEDVYIVTGIINVIAPDGVQIEWDDETNKVIIVIPNKRDIPLTSIGGNVWEDAKTGKASLGDGINNTSNGVDKNLENIKVSLYTQNGTLATLTPTDDITNVYHRINPTLTDKKGNYRFEGVDASKKYYVVFEYDGQVYMPTEYLAKGISGDTIQNYKSVQEMLNDIGGSSIKGDNNIGKTQGKETNTWFDVWKSNSKASEFETDMGKVSIESRETFNSRFAEIGSSPKNYVTKNNLNIKLYLTYSEGKHYNKTYTRLELMGYTLKQVDGKPEYVQNPKEQLVDGYKYNKYGTLNYDENGRITNEWAEGLISKKIKDFIRVEKHYPDYKEMMEIYREIVADMEDEEAWNKLQFIEDCKISAITKSPFNNEGIEYYPTDKNDHFGEDLLTNYVNLGLWRRQEFNAQLIKDVTAIEYTINGKTETYKYDGKKTALENIKSCMDTYITAKDDTNLAWIYSTSQENINKIRISNNYYNTKYNRAIYNSDYEAKAGIGEDLDIQIKYRITIMNTSQSIETQIKEIVDYYDDSLTLREVKINGTNITLIPRTSIYGSITEAGFKGYNKIYISGDLLEKQITTGGEINIDLTYKVNEMRIEDLDNYLNIGEKTNIAEINGYKTYYAANTSTPNRHGEIIGNNTTIAGLIDVNSTPGNLSTTETITDGVYNFEDDSDKITATLEIKPNPDNSTEEAKRTINGYVWEDSKVSDGLGNGIRDDNETKIKGVNVALCEKIKITTSSYEIDQKLLPWISEYNQQLEGYKYIPAKTCDGTSWTPAVTKTDENGYYEFKGFIPGDYYVIFGYGYSDETLLPKNSETTNLIGKFGENNKSYNGQDYKSTIFENGINTKNDSWRDDLGTYSYSLDATLISDAIDDLDRVDKVNSYSKEQTNHIAEVLVSPYNVPKYPRKSYDADDMNSLLNELKDRTWKVAKTRKIDAKVEYASNGTTNAIDARGKEETKEWTLPNLDLGLVERPKTQLEITKNVKNVKVTLSDGSIVFDATQTAEATKGNEIKDVIWKSNKFNTTKGITPTWGFIQLYLDEELMYGATIQIEYNMNITQPINEIDYTGDNYYVKGKKDGALVTTNATEVICYIPNKMQFDKTINEDKWSLIEDTQKEIFDNGLVNINLTDKVNSIDTKVKIEDGNVANISENNLTVSQLITKESAQGGYVSVVEIVKIQNSVGRRMAEYIINPNDKEEKTIYPIVGNQNPTEAPAEIDSAKGEDVAVMPPFGARHVYYYVLGIVVAGVLVAGIVLIKKKVLKK